MLYRLSVIFLFLFLICVSTKAQTADEIISRYVAATGGAEKWKSVETLIVIHRSAAFSFDLYWKKPNRVKLQVPVEYPEPSETVRSFDGTNGWCICPMEGSDKPRRLAGGETLELLQMADGYFWFLDYKTKGYTAELLGKETLEGNTVYKMKITSPVAGPQLVYFDAKTYLEVRREIATRTPEGEDRTIVTVIGDYRRVGNLLLPHKVGAAVREYQINTPMGDQDFKMPGITNDVQQSSSSAGMKSENFAQRLATPDQRAALLKENPNADVNGDGILDLEEGQAFLKMDQAARKLLPVGTIAPDWTLKGADEKSHKLSDYRGKVVVMDFWAVWCVQCHRAMPALQKLHSMLSSRGVVVIGISTNEHGGDPVQLMKDRGYSYPLMLHGETISETYRVAGMPTIYVVGVDGRIIHSGFGGNAIAEERRFALIDSYLTEHGM